MEPRALCTVGMCCTTELHFQCYYLSLQKLMIYFLGHSSSMIKNLKTCIPTHS